jgi:hypothetical protein
MQPRRPSPESLMVLAAILVRVAAVFALGSYSLPRTTYEHGEIAANLLAGRGFSVRYLGVDGPTSQQAPAYPVFVAAAYALCGVETPASLRLIQLAQAALGGLLVAGTMRLAREVAPGRPVISLTAGAFAAFHPTLVYATTHVQVAVFATTSLVWTFAYAYSANGRKSLRSASAAGALLALVALADPILALAAPALVWIMGLDRGFKAATKPALVMAAVAAACVAPWIVRNAFVHGEFVAIKSSFGYAFWQGNCSLSHGTDKVVRSSVERALASSPPSSSLGDLNKALWAARHEAGCIDDIALTPADYAKMARLNEPARSRYLFGKALSDLGAQPGRFSRLCLARFKAFVLFDETNPKTRSVIYRAGHLALTLAAALGLILMPGDLRKRLAPTFLAAALIAAFHSLTIVSARFHIPIEPLMGLWAAAGLARIRNARVVSVPSAARAHSAQPRRPTTSIVSGS